MRTVYRAVQLTSGKVFALKLVNNRLRRERNFDETDPANVNYRLALAREFQMLASLHHPNVIRVHTLSGLTPMVGSKLDLPGLKTPSLTSILEGMLSSDDSVTQDIVQLSELLPEVVRPVLEKMLEPRPQDRFHDANQVILALSAALGVDLPVETAATRESFLTASLLVGRDAELTSDPRRRRRYSSGSAIPSAYSARPGPADRPRRPPQRRPSWCCDPVFSLPCQPR